MFSPFLLRYFFLYYNRTTISFLLLSHTVNSYFSRICHKIVTDSCQYARKSAYLRHSFKINIKHLLLTKLIYSNSIKLYITFFLSFYILSNVRKALFYRLYGHFYFLFTFAYRGISSYVFPLKRGKFRGKYFYAIRRFISVLALSIEECAYQSIVILILE